MTQESKKAWTLHWCWPNDDFFGPAPHYAVAVGDDEAIAEEDIPGFVLEGRPYCLFNPDDLPSPILENDMAWFRDNLDWENPDGYGTAEPFGPYIV